MINVIRVGVIRSNNKALAYTFSAMIWKVMSFNWLDCMDNDVLMILTLDAINSSKHSLNVTKAACVFMWNREAEVKQHLHVWSDPFC